MARTRREVVESKKFKGNPEFQYLMTKGIERVSVSVQEFLKLEKQTTLLWEKRGIKWDKK